MHDFEIAAVQSGALFHWDLWGSPQNASRIVYLRWAGNIDPLASIGPALVSAEITLTTVCGVGGDLGQKSKSLLLDNQSGHRNTILEGPGTRK